MHLALHLAARDPATEDGGDRKVFAHCMRQRRCEAHIRTARVNSRHVIVRAEALLHQLGHSERLVRLGRGRDQGRVAAGEEVQTRERHHVDTELAHVRVQLTRELAR